MAVHDLKTEDFIKKQVETIDRLLLNAYGTVYKLIAKNVAYKNRGCVVREMEEMLIAKNLTSDLWSVLDYCCLTLSCHFNKEEPKSSILSKRIKFPCNFRTDISREKDCEEWEKKHLQELILNGKPLSDDDYEAFKRALSHVQHHCPHQTKKVEVAEKVMTFYRLHFLRNIIAHSNIQITGEKQATKFKALDPNKNSSSRSRRIASTLAVTITIPETPWSEDLPPKPTRLPLMDFLFDACELVEDCRDVILEPMGQRKFKDSFGFRLADNMNNRGAELAIVVFLNENNESKEVPLNYNHLECYGIEQDLKEEDEDEEEEEK